MSVASVFDFEGVIGNAAATVLKAGGFVALTQLDQPESQKPRPRVEVIFQVGGQRPTGPRAILPDGSVRIAGYHGVLLLHCITDVDAPGKQTHGSYRAAVRNFCTGLMPLLNGSALTQHKVQLINEAASTHGFAPDKGYEGSTLQFAVEFSIQNDAFITLAGSN